MKCDSPGLATKKGRQAIPLSGHCAFYCEKHAIYVRLGTCRP